MNSSSANCLENHICCVYFSPQTFAIRGSFQIDFLCCLYRETHSQVEPGNFGGEIQDLNCRVLKGGGGTQGEGVFLGNPKDSGREP